VTFFTREISNKITMISFGQLNKKIDVIIMKAKIDELILEMSLQPLKTVCLSIGG